MSIVDVAKRAGVSVSTVSRVINHHPGVSPKTEIKIREVIAELQYVPPAPDKRRGPKPKVRNGLGGGMILLLLSRRNTEGLGSSALLTHLEAGFHEAAAEHNGAICIASTPEKGELNMPGQGAEIKAALIMDPHISADCLRSLGDIPLVYVLTPPLNRPLLWDVVEPGNQEAGRLAAAHLLSRGHRRLAVINPFCCWASSMARVTGFASSARLGGALVHLLDNMSCADAWADISVPCESRHPLACRALAERFLALDPRPTGLFVVGDSMAGSVSRTLVDAGVCMGKDVELVSCNNDPGALASMDPAPFTFDMRPYEVGRQAVEVAVARCQGDLTLPPFRLSIPPPAGSSCGPMSSATGPVARLRPPYIRCRKHTKEVAYALVQPADCTVGCSSLEAMSWAESGVWLSCFMPRWQGAWRSPRAIFRS